MHIGIIDADLIGRKRHRFPNLACMKISGYHKALGDTIELLMDYDRAEREEFDKIYLSKVFTDTQVREGFIERDNVEYGGTGFFFDKAPNLPNEIEHSKPDYDLYKDFVEERISSGVNPVEFKEYTDYSIGFLTRGCFRKCAFCVNQKYNKVFEHSPIEEFLDPSRPKICLLDDNFLGCPNWRELLQQLKATGKPFKFKQGLDERLLTEEKCVELFNSKYDGEFTFAFDNIADKEIIIQKLEILKKHTTKSNIKFYVFCGFNHEDPHTYAEEFWVKDIIDLFERMRILSEYRCLPYVMRYKDYELSPYRGLYINIARWANQPSFYKKKSFYEYCTMDCHKGKATERYLLSFMEKYPEVAEQYFYRKWEQ